MSDWFWAPVAVPPLRADIERRSRAYRQYQARVRRGAWYYLAALLGTAAGALAALPPETWA